MITQLTADDFTDALHKQIFDLIVAIYNDGIVPSLGVFYKEAHKYGLVDSVRKLEEIKTALTDWEYTTDNIQYWINELISTSKARELFWVLRKYEATLSEYGKKDIDDTLAGAVNDLSQIDLGRTKDEMEDGKQIGIQLEEIVAAKISRYTEINLTGKVALEGLPTGFSRLDQLTLGYKPGDLIILAAQTGHGKTAFALQTAKTIAIDHSKSLLYINTEMSKEIVYQRLCGVVSGVPFYDIRQGNLTQEDQSRVSQAIKIIKKSPITHVYAPHLTPVRCVVMGKRAKIQKKVEMIIVDYIGRMEKHDPKLQEWQVLEQVAKSMKLLAQELRIPVLVLAQLNEEGTLQGSKRIKNECDLLLILAPLKSNEKTEKYDKRYLDANYRLYVSKNRDGEPEKNIALNFNKPLQQIRSAKPLNDEWANIGRYIGEED